MLLPLDRFVFRIRVANQVLFSQWAAAMPILGELNLPVLSLTCESLPPILLRLRQNDRVTIPVAVLVSLSCPLEVIRAHSLD